MNFSYNLYIKLMAKNIGILASMSWNSNGWQEPATREDIARSNFDYVKERFKEAGISWMYFNSSPINPGAQKPHFNLLLDDSAGLNEALELFKTFLDEIETTQI